MKTSHLTRAAANARRSADTSSVAARADAPDARETKPVAQRRWPRRRRRSRRLWLGVGLVGLIALVIGTAWVLDQRTKATPFPLDDAVTELHSGAPDASDDAATPTSAAAPADNLDNVGPAPVTEVPGATPARGAPVADAASTSDFTPPRSGVYTYATAGGDKVSMLGARHDYPEQTHAILTERGDCGWHVEQRVVQEHIDNYDWCSSSDGLQLLTLRHDIEFFAQRDSIEYHCPADGQFVAATDAKGATHHTVCTTSDNDRLDMMVTVTGRGTRTLGGVTVPTITYRADFKMTGKATGSARWDGIIHAATGLRLYEHRVVSTEADALFGDVHYDEDVTFELLSLDPAK